VNFIEISREMILKHEEDLHSTSTKHKTGADYLISPESNVL
jgi:hypothetical protein